MPEERLALENQNQKVMSNGAVTFFLYLNKAEKYAGEYGLSFGDMVVLRYLYGLKDEINLSQLRDGVMMLSGASITKITEKLVQRGVLARRENPKSRREKLVKITPKGRKLYARLMKQIHKLNTRATKGLNSAEKSRFVKVLNAIQGNLINLGMDD